MIRTNISRVAPDWDLWKRLFQLSYSAVANFTRVSSWPFCRASNSWHPVSSFFRHFWKKLSNEKSAERHFIDFFSNNLSLAAFVRWKSFSNGRSISDHSERKKVFILLSIKISNNFSKNVWNSGLFFCSLFCSASLPRTSVRWVRSMGPFLAVFGLPLKALVEL